MYSLSLLLRGLSKEYIGVTCCISGSSGPVVSPVVAGAAVSVVFTLVILCDVLTMYVVVMIVL